MSLILVVGEVAEGAISAVSAELLSAASRIKRDGDSVMLALAGDELGSVSAEAVSLPADTVQLVEHPSLKDGGTGGFDAPVAALTALCRETAPETVLLAKTDFGANVGPRLAARLNAGFAQDCTDIGRESGRLSVTRPVYGGNALAVFSFAEGVPQVLTIRPSVFEPASADGSAAEVGRFDPSPAMGQERTRLVETVREERKGVRLQEADIVVSGGRGLGGPEPFEKLKELAERLNGALGASRAACDAGWIDHSHQVGLTGKTVAPQLYLAFGISGASQHMAGCSGAKCIVAVNRDPDANIFKEARFGVVGDWAKVYEGLRAALDDLPR